MPQRAAVLLLLPALCGCPRPAILLRPKAPLNGGSTVHIKVYQLKDDLHFQKADFDDLWNTPVETLKGDLLKTVKEDDVLPPMPGEQPRKIDFLERKFAKGELDEQCKYFGVAALFAPPQPPTKEEQSRWKRVVLRDQSSNFVFELHQYELKVLPD